MCENQTWWYIHRRLDLINICTQFQLNRVRMYNSEFKLSDTAVTLNYNQGHRKWYECVKLNEHYHHAKFDIYNI